MEALARQSLRWDAGYCAVMGAATAIWFKPVAGALDAPRPLIAVMGVGSVVWAGLVVILSRIPSWRPATTLVVAVNLAAAVTLAVIGLWVEGPAGRQVVLGGVAIQVLALAALQAHALWSPFRR